MATSQELENLMEDLGELVLEYKTDRVPLEHLVTLQRAYENAGNWVKMPGIEDLRHVQHHLTKLLGKIATITEAYEHLDSQSTDEERAILFAEINRKYGELMQKMPPDLLIYAMHFAIRDDQNLTAYYHQRIKGLMEERK